MRVIAGAARGRKLQSVKGMNTRPTADRIRESVFSIINAHISGARVLDLFAGSGAMGIEALSRGAAAAVFIDNNAGALQTVRRNLEITGFLPVSRVVRKDAVAFLRGTSESFDIIFVDPPYRSGLYEAVLTVIRDRGILRSGGIVVLERGFGVPPVSCSGFAATLDRKYGNISITVMEEKDDEDSCLPGQL